MTTRTHRDSSFSRRNLAIAIGMALAAGSSQAAVIQVTNTGDSGPGSFRQAIEDANAAAGADTVDFSPVTGQTIALADDLPQITDDLTLQGSQVTLDGATEHTCLSAYFADLTVNDMTITRCTGYQKYENSEPEYTEYGLFGGGIHIVSGNLTVDNSRIIDNGPPADTETERYALAGGGISFFADGDSGMTISNSEISGNTSHEGAGGVYAYLYGAGLVDISNTVIDGNRGFEGAGGALISADSGDITLSNVSIRDNGYWLPEGETEPRGGTGAYLYSYGAIDLDNCTISGNQASNPDGFFAPGGLLAYAYSSGTTIANSTISGNSTDNGAGGALIVGTLTLTDSEISGNTNSGSPDSFLPLFAGGLASMTASYSGPTGQSAGRGEVSAKYGEVTISGTTISGNTSTIGGGVTMINLGGTVSIDGSEISDNEAGSAAGMYVLSDSSEFTLSRSTISNNQANAALVDNAYGGSGGGLSVLNKYPGTVSLSQSTISGNTAENAAGAYIVFQAGGPQIEESGQTNRGAPELVQLDGVTMTENSATAGPGGGLTALFQYPAQVGITGSIIAGNSSTEGSADLGAEPIGAEPQPLAEIARSGRLARAFPRLDLSGFSTRGQLPSPDPTPENTTFVVDHSIIGEAPDDPVGFQADTVSQNLLGEDPLLGDLAENGGPTPTHLPQSGSPALGIVTAAAGCGATGFDLDQRGRTRPDPTGTDCDAGSVERGLAVIDANPDADFGNVTTVQEVSFRQVTLANNGNESLEVSGFEGPTDPFGLDFSDCAASLPFELAAGEDCTLVASFTPLAEGSFAQTVTVNSNSDEGDDQFTLTGNGVTPTLDFDPLAFGDQLVGQPTQGDIVLSNSGDGFLLVYDVSLGAPRGTIFSLLGNDCSQVNPGESCTITVGFTPPSEGAFDDVVVVTTNADSEPAQVPVSGQGVIGELSVSPEGDIGFGDVLLGGSGQTELTLTNTGSAPLTIEDWTNLPEPFSISGDCPEPPFTLQPDESCTLVITFSPENPGDYEQVLEFGFDGGTGSSSTQVNVNGRGINPALPVPTLDRIGLIIGSGLLALMGLLGLRRRKVIGD